MCITCHRTTGVFAAAALAAPGRGAMTEHRGAGALAAQIAEEYIARRAYEIYESRGRADGHAEDDWFRAASEYAARHLRSAGGTRRYGPTTSFADRVREALA